MLRKYVVSLYVLVLPTYKANVIVSVRPYTRAGCADGGDRGVLDGWYIVGQVAVVWQSFGRKARERRGVWLQQRLKNEWKAG